MGEWAKCIYVHRKKTDNSIFYVGIGNKYRPKSKLRSSLWERVANKYGYKVEILMTGLSIDKAIMLEIDLIKQYGRINNKTGVLANLTDGGEGQVNRFVSKKTRNKISKTKVKNGMLGGYDVIDKTTGIKYHSLRKACIDLNLSYGTIFSQIKGKRTRSKSNNLYFIDENLNSIKIDSRNKTIKNKETGELYKSIKEASKTISVGVSTLSQHLNGFRYNEKLKNIIYYE